MLPPYLSLPFESAEGCGSPQGPQEMILTLAFFERENQAAYRAPSGPWDTDFTKNRMVGPNQLTHAKG